MKHLKKGFALILAAVIAALALPGAAYAEVVSAEDAAHSIYGNQFNNVTDLESLPKSASGDISLGTTVLATDEDGSGKVTVKIPLLYKNSTNVRASLSMFEIRASFEAGKDWPFSSNENTVKRLTDIQRADPTNYKDPKDYVEFTFDVSKEALNGLYSIKFDVRHLDIFQNPYFDTPATSTLLLYVKIVNGKEPPEETTPPPSTTPKPVSKPRLMLEGFSTNPDPVLAANEFDLTLVFANTHPERDIQNVTGKISESENMALPVSGSSTFYIDKVKAGESVEVTIRMKTDANAGVKPTRFTLDLAYEDNDNIPIESKEDFVMPVFQEVKLEHDEPRYDLSFTKGASSYIYMNIYNMGKSTVYNVMVRLESSYVQLEENYFAGNIEMGSSRSLDTVIIERTGMPESYGLDSMGNEKSNLMRAAGGVVVSSSSSVSMAVPMPAPDANAPAPDGSGIEGDFVSEPVPAEFTGMVPDANLVITYEDKDGQQFKKEIPLSLNILPKEDYSSTWDPGMDPGMTETEQGFWKPWMTYAAAGVGALIVVIIILVARSRKKRKALEDEAI